ncbi:MoaD/ThiS family protein [Haloferax mediterranei ATCC 33500]|uniref:MoaD/ThiS family protein n=1 Tax=Haloferax mediterranei (strain ATCC 33500 / DSM 1411 / JCM 8866 / NBRC 14739 / NCIMB 2177 / R-4) TaxID=523841 RepID=I3R6R4_HALMT|nr:ubiquitin-like small modifier protein 1 [Haloferax mediterranei]AFK19924.1 molybdopterin converting factor subunit 1 [Haloferax mediterranei ATCC 33500]AHZ23303.1 molybdopterin converting factor [Haloferax mediterranei ATCC 33500]ELZ99469.1 molybdopterin converting factor subunit 1 [Haloferax mediterranei ATCC 33500]MDX5987326.1 ubiquitin-like small modifier protein 1 [Haloferax mediterranei ATCC 33500]QCQ73841.1 MoaD/ThiS family protein [Haloferax mediterranei ATCC 33500]
MELELRFFATFREVVGQKTIHWRVDDGSTVGNVLHSLEAEYDGFSGQLIENGDIRPHVNVLKNGREVVHLDGLETDLEDGDAVSVFPPVAGG